METTETAQIAQEQAVPPPFNALTIRELQIATLLAIGATNREIAEDLRISQKTVDTHRAHALAKVGARNNVALARLALRAGLVDLDEA